MPYLRCSHPWPGLCKCQVNLPFHFSINFQSPPSKLPVSPPTELTIHRQHMAAIHRSGCSILPQDQINLAAWDAYGQKQQNNILAREVMYLTEAEIEAWARNVNTFADGGMSWDGNWGMQTVPRTLPRMLDGTRPPKMGRRNASKNLR